MVASAAMLDAAEDLLAGIPVITSVTHGRHSRLQRVALRARASRGSAVGLVDLLGLTAQELVALYYEPIYSLRPVQAPPLHYRTFFFMGGRGAGKTYSGACAVIEEARADPEARILIVGPTYSEIVKNQLEGTSGILTLSPPWFYPKYEKAKRRLVWPNGAQATWLPAKNADKFRGHQYTFIWADEPVAWKGDAVAVYKECRAVNRLRTSRMRREGLSARMFITTTPAPTALFREMLGDRDGLVLARSSTLENTDNLDPAYVRYARRVMHSTEGKREFMGELTFAMDPALYRKVNWTKTRVAPKKRPSSFDYIVISIDPATGEKKTSDLHGIVVVGVRREADGMDHVYVLADLSLQSPEPSAWAKKAVEALRYWEPYAAKDSRGRPRAWIFAETNSGGNMVKSTIRTVAKVKLRTERARQSKAERAAPVSSYAESGLVHMVGKHEKLEAQLAKFTGAEGGHGRDDRADAFAWPIFKYVIPKRQNVGAAEREVKDVTAGSDRDEDE
ncbi:large terminase [Myxococcus llanfairpwllgwyngyllgogerychwyrndrobwllllantysiliogogogochensis]|uniref:Large terminase n=1 Tax=Myxococcus llanfairpwllgwyngyllgogerychwyrndrobwllllantysiliogogogochensis TaxID=2590453 RepID=A0A540WJ77_9BACT|nr:terminase family protein [Myxococcus llanfairpwllgwyngyllgogerychwyrndrobwllllantysiliogogogochensis]TQF09075.1 large terminase [Myxococcus llanfairpwllgwyngyllgogerychwyrndrobwllllantysiliogogogochensis]